MIRRRNTCRRSRPPPLRDLRSRGVRPDSAHFISFQRKDVAAAAIPKLCHRNLCLCVNAHSDRMHAPGRSLAASGGEVHLWVPVLPPPRSDDRVVLGSSQRLGMSVCTAQEKRSAGFSECVCVCHVCTGARGGPSCASASWTSQVQGAPSRKAAPGEDGPLAPTAS